MSLVNPYCSVAQVQEELRNTSAPLAVSGGALEDAINQASRWIDTYKGRDYFLHDYSVNPLLIDRSDRAILVQDSLWFPYTPIIVFTSVTVAGQLWVADTDYVLKSDRLIAIPGWFGQVSTQFCSLLPNLTDRVSILGKFGYDQANSAAIPTGLPQEINRAAILVAAAFSGHNQKEIVGMDGNKAGVTDKTIPKAVFDILGKRRNFM